ncbi:synaptobrevin-1-like [Panonychus citri]|uniref:synaptobrevin-1-like n=1 Tax=Panonychus citri TaxID=50023 RepID=UPI002307DA06|nr:synaptobrevin-1-like [Panonychus citri]
MSGRGKKDEKDVEKGKPEADQQDDDPDKPKPSQNVQIAQKRMQQTQAQVDEVTEIMRMNVEKVLERDAMISQLDERADALKEGAEMFEKQAGALKSKYWWKNAKMIAVMVGVGLVFVLVIFAWFSGN